MKTSILKTAFHALPGNLLFAANDDASPESLRAELIAINDRMREINDPIEAANRAPTAAEQRELDDLFDRFDIAKARLTKLEGEARNGRIADASAAAGLPDTAAAQAHAAREGASATRVVAGVDARAASMTVRPTSRFEALPPGPAGRRCRDLFSNHAVQSLGGFRSADEFVNVIRLRQTHSALIDASNATHIEGIGADGGFMVPTQFLAGILDSALETEIVRPRARVIGMTSNVAALPGIEASDRRLTIGGLAGQWLDEAMEMTPQKSRMRLVQLKCDKLGILCEASNELVQDGVGFAGQLTQSMGQALSYDLDGAFLAGTGAGQPLGALNSPTCIEVTPESGQAADTILYHNIIKMRGRLHPACWKNAVWHCSPDVLPQLMLMTFPDSSPSVPVWLPANSVANQPFDMLLGRPLIVTEKAEILGDRGDLVLADWSQYAVGMRLVASLAMSQEPGFTRDTSHWRLIIRTTGQPLWNSVVTPRNGGPTLSWCVTLGAR